MEKKLLAVIGGGVVGLATARHAARRGLDVIVLERNNGIGQECSGRNSEVIHAGIYYPQGSLKAELCVKGRKLLYEFCQEYHVPHEQCGKLIVATSKDQINTLQQIQQKAKDNHVDDIVYFSEEEVRQLEPEVHSFGALYSPSTGIIDSHGFMQALLGDAENHSACVALNCSVERGEFDTNARMINLYHRPTDKNQEHELEVLSCNYVVNCAGLSAPSICNSFHHLEPIFSVPVPQQFAKGNYFRLSESLKPFRHLIYPVPEKGGLGIHATIDLASQVRFGPDVEWVSTLDYEVNTSKAAKFASRIESYWPDVKDHQLVPDYSGIRPKVVGPSEPDADFQLYGSRDHGVPGLIHCVGIESPGLTSSLAIAEKVLGMLVGR